MNSAKATYAEVYERSIKDPDGFWSDAAAEVDWFKPWDKTLDDSRSPFNSWFVGGRLNTCHNAVDRHLPERADQTAIIHDSPVTGTQRKISYAELHRRVSHLAGLLKQLGVGKGDRVVIYMPMIPETVYAMLACARIGAVHSVVFGGFSGAELAKRIDHCRPKAVLAASCGVEPARIVDFMQLLEDGLRAASHAPEKCVIFRREQSPGKLKPGRDIEWQDAVEGAPPADCAELEATDPLYVLYTSGTTGSPKGIVRDNGGHAVAMAWTLPRIYGIQPGECWWSASDVGWIVGHSYIIYSPLINGCTTVVYEGKPVGTPDPGAFWRLIAEHGVVSLFTAPTAIRSIRREDPDAEHIAKHPMPEFRSLFLAGERSDPETIAWAQRHLNVPVIDHWWQTETSWAICSNFLGIEEFPVKPGSATKPVPGYDLQVLDDDGSQVGDGSIGNLVVKSPLPPGTLRTLWDSDEGFVENYFSRYQGYYLTGDAGYRDEDGYFWVMSRIDDVINVAGHRLSTGAIEEALARHPVVAECAVIGVADELKGELPLGLVVTKAQVEFDKAKICEELVSLVREEIGPVAAFKLVNIVGKLPKTRSGKILRGTMKKIADGGDPKVPPTIEDPAALDVVRESLGELGYPSS